MRSPFRRSTLLVLLLALPACIRGFEPRSYPTPESLYRASLDQFRRGKWANASAGFERLTLDLPARDSLLPLAFLYLGRAQARNREALLASGTFTRLAETFPDDTLADDALFEGAKALASLWRNPTLDPQYGLQAQQQLRTLVAAYPDSPLRAQAEAEIRRLDEWLARKDYENGMHYLRRKAYDSAIIYFRDVVKGWPETDTARRARLRLLEAYREIRYDEDAREMCQTLRQNYPQDREVRDACGAAPAAPAPADTARTSPVAPAR